MSSPKSIQTAQSAPVENSLDTEPATSIDAAIQGALGRKLRESYDEIVKEKVPDKFMHLLDQLKHSEKEGES